MSSRESKRDYRGRGKNASRHYRHDRDNAQADFDTGKLVPIDVEAPLPTAEPIVGANGIDPFAPQTSTGEFARKLKSEEAERAANASQSFANAYEETTTSEAEPVEEVAEVASEPVADATPEPEPELDPEPELEDAASALVDATPEPEPVVDAAPVDPDPAADEMPADVEPEPAVPEVSESEVDRIMDSLRPAKATAAAASAAAVSGYAALEAEQAAVEEAAPVQGVPIAQTAVFEGAAPQAQADASSADAALEQLYPQDEDASKYSRENAQYSHRPGFSRKQKIALIVIAAVCVVLCAVGGAAFAMWQNYQSNIALKDASIADQLPSVAHGEPYWVLILGSDTRSTDTDDSRSDVIMLARVDEVSKKVTLVSIPRDTKVTLEGYGTQKINAAYALGGAKLAISTVSKYAGVDISHYVEVYFKGFRKVVDEIGGVDVDVPEYVSYKDVTLQPGFQHLDGKQALTFARNRKTYTTGDFRRTECQRILVQAIAEKVLSQDITQLPGAIDALTECFSTDMPLQDVVGLATSMKGISEDAFYSAMAPSTTGMVDGVSYTFTYINQWKLLMQRAIRGDDPTIDDEEAAICGTASTQTEELDMSVGLPDDIQKAINKYQKKKAKEEAEKETKAQKKAKKKAENSSDESDSESGE